MALLRTATSSDLGPVIQSDRVLLRTPQMSDYPDWAELRAASCEFLQAGHCFVDDELGDRKRPIGCKRNVRLGLLLLR